MKKCLLLVWLMISSNLIVLAQTKDQADSLHQRGRELLNEGQIIEGRECTWQAMEIRKKLLGEVSEDYITSLNNYALTFSATGDYSKAVELQENVMALCGKLEKPHKNIGLFTANMGRFYYLNGDPTKAATMWEQALPLVEKYGEIYEYLLNSLAAVYDKSGDSQGLIRVMDLMEDHNQHELTKPCDEPKCMLDRAQYYAVTGNLAMAKECYLKVLGMSADAEMKIQIYESYASFLSNQKDYASASDYYVAAANIRKTINGETETYANLMYQAGICAFIGGEYEKSVSAYQSAINFFSKFNSDAAKKNVALCMKGMGNAYSGLKDYTKAKECFLEVVSYYELNDQNSEEYPKAIYRLAKAEKSIPEYAISIEHHKQAMAMFDERGMIEDYSDAANSLQLCYFYAGINETVDGKRDRLESARIAKLDEIIRQEEESMEIMRDYLGKMTSARSLATLGGCYVMKGYYVHGISYYQQYMEAVREAVRDQFRLQNEAERMKTWEDEKSNMSNILELLINLPEGNDSLVNQLTGIIYDAELLSKGILLNSAIEFDKVLIAKGDAKLTDLYEQTKANEAEIERLRNSAVTDEDLSHILELTQRNQSLQLELFRGCAEFADFTNYISYTWKDVQKAMQQTDVAIEFAIIDNGAFLNDNLLMALVLTKDMVNPVVVPICNMSKLMEIESDTAIFDKPDAGITIWGAIQPYFTNKKRLFFSADGVLNRIAIEYLPYNGKPLSEQYEVYRMSSTKELCYKRESMKLSKAALFGDINYNDEATQSETSQRSLASLRGADGFNDLGNTLREVNEIQNILKEKGMKDVVRFRDTEASKTAFLNLTDSKVNLLHIATHGMYRHEQKSIDAESMQNSILAFAGANLDDEGLVTAADIATMNLRQCDLAVLSACETGLGKLGNDGVFGLQRGFKNAGVHSLLMSLKNVYDESTADLMISFYRHLMSGSSKREALVKAQQDIREKGFKAPKYWASFILLDGLD